MIGHTFLVLALLQTAAPASPGRAAAQPSSPTSRWPLNAEAMLAADAVSYAPPDFKRVLTRNRDRLMRGVKDAAESDSPRRSVDERRKDAARGARRIAQAIRDHSTFADVAYMAGGLIHELASANLPEKPELPQGSQFLGYTAEPFADPETLVLARLPKGGARQSYDASLTLSTRLLAWIWKKAGGDASITSQYPEAKGPYFVRE